MSIYGEKEYLTDMEYKHLAWQDAMEVEEEDLDEDEED